jgi:hypothetical protein
VTTIEGLLLGHGGRVAKLEPEAITTRWTAGL